jgi:hypothetical protein
MTGTVAIAFVESGFPWNTTIEGAVDTVFLLPK